MQPITFLILTVLLACAVYCDDSGHYSKSKYNSEGDYVNDVSKWAYHHVDDQRDLGKYHHVHIPYDGGYGPYDHIPNPYNHQDSKYVDEFGQIPYVPFHDKYGYTPFKDQHGYKPFRDQHGYTPFNDKYPYAQGGSSDLGVSIDPFMNKFFNDPTPEFLALYGVPDQGRQINTIKKIFKRNVENLISQKNAEARKRYETENGITAAEQAKTKTDGTNGSGFYEYTGDDDKVYRVEYQADENGFIPQGDHIHPEIRKHLDNIKNKKYDY